MELAKFHTSFSCQLQVSAARVGHFLDVETCEFWQVPSLYWDTLISLLLINIVGQASLKMISQLSAKYQFGAILTESRR